jgi:hypothetical protein
MAITRTQIARQLYRFGGDTMGESTNDISLKEAKDMAPKGEFLAYINEKEAKMLKDAGGSGIMTNAGIPSFVEYGGRSGFDSAKSTGSVQGDVDRGSGGGPKRPNKSKISNATNTIGDAMLLKNMINFNPMGIMKNIGSKVLFDKLSRVNPEEGEEDNMLLADALTTPTEETMGLNLMDRKTLNNAGYSNTQIEELQNNPNIDTQDVIRDIKGPIFAADGGIMNTDVVGGEMDFESARQMYGLGKLVKKVTRSVKKIAKSPIGKAALLYTGLGGLGSVAGGGTFFGNFMSPMSQLRGVGSIFSKPGFENILARAKLGSFSTTADVMKPVFEKNFLGKALTSPTALISGVSAVSGLLTAEQEEEAQEIADSTGIDIAEIRADPDKYLGRRFRAEGGSMDEPVAKKTMP